MMSIGNIIATAALCVTLMGGSYAALIGPMQDTLKDQSHAITRSIDTAAQTRVNTQALAKQDARIALNHAAIQRGEINSARLEVQMDHLTGAIKELTQTIKDNTK
jgi:hemoglobin-like flavoprotein